LLHKDVMKDVLERVENHRHQKIQMLQCHVVVLVIWFAASHCAGIVPKDCLSFHLCPPAEEIGAAFAFWLVEVSVDSLLDELAPISKCHCTLTCISLIVGVVSMLTLIVRLTLAPFGGHHLFVITAVQVLIGTLIGRTLDSILWKCIALSASFILGVAFACGLLPKLPKSVLHTASYGFLLSTATSEAVYQSLQNGGSPHAAVVLSKLVGLCSHTFAMQHLGSPVAWVLYDLMTRTYFFCSKIAVDTLALWILRC